MLIFGILLICGLLIFLFFRFSLGLVKKPYDIAYDTDAPAGGIRAIGIIFIVICALAIIFLFVFIHNILTPTVYDWIMAGICFVGLLAIIVAFIGVCLLKGLTIGESLRLIFRFLKETDSKPKMSKKLRKVVGITSIVAAVALVVLFVNLVLIYGPGGSSNDKSNDKCSVCHRSFKPDSPDSMSIARSNMCENCHDNYIWREKVQDIIDNKYN